MGDSQPSQTTSPQPGRALARRARALTRRARAGSLSPFGRMFRAARRPEGMADELEDLAARGSVVFVMHSPSELNVRFVRWLVRRYGLPPLGAVIGVGEMLPGEKARRRHLDRLRQAVAARQTALIFMHRGSSFQLGAPGLDPFPELVELQRTLPHPVLLVPLLFVWSRRPRQLKPTLLDRVFGPPEAPGLLATGLAATLAFVRNFRRAHVRMARPVDLAAFIASAAGPQSSAALLGRKVRSTLYHYLSRETRAALGPPFRAPERVRDEVLRDRRLQETVDQLATESGRSRRELLREARRNIKEIAARMTPWVFGALQGFVRWLLRRTYDAQVIDDAGLRAVSEAATRGAVVLCPSHKSYFDFVVMSQLCYERGLLPPHIAAGINMSFWPFGSLARRCGAFFIRRQFRGQRIYTAALRAYVKLLLRMGFPQEVFIEGGRSRTGKLLLPRTGLLSMEVDAWAESDSTDVFLVPVAIDYEKVPEGAALAREVGGGEKKGEKVTDLVGARKVLASRHGRVYVQFAAPLSLDALAGVGEGSRGKWLASLGEDERRAFVQRVAATVTWGIGSVSTITAVGLIATALLAARDGRVLAPVLARRLGHLRALAAERRARFAPELAEASLDHRAGGAFADGMALVAGAGMVKVAPDGQLHTVPAERRAELDFSRNAVLHHFIAAAIVAAAMRAEGRGEAVEAGRVRDSGRWLSRLLKLEFNYQVGSNPDRIFEDVLAQLQAVGVLQLEGGVLRGAGGEGGADTLQVLAEMTRPFVDAYRMTAVACASWNGGPRKAFVRATLDRCRIEYQAGRINPESINKNTVENATEWLLGEELLQTNERGELRTASGAGRRIAELIESIDRYR